MPPGKHAKAAASPIMGVVAHTTIGTGGKQQTIRPTYPSQSSQQIPLSNTVRY